MLIIVSDSNGKDVATGTGFFVSEDGKLVTNWHVTENASSMIAKAESGAFYKVRGVLAEDRESDIVVLQVEAKEIPFLILGDSQQTKVGEHIAIIGSPLGLEGTLSEGIVSAIRELGTNEWLQITAAISPGSSGSPVLNADGKVVGVATMLLRGGQSLNFAIPSGLVRALTAGLGVTNVPKALGAVKKADGLSGSARKELREVYRLLSRLERAKALQAAKSFAEKYPNTLEAYELLASTYELAGLYDDAADASKKGLALDANNTSFWRSLGSAYKGKKEYDRAVDAYRRAIKINPVDAETWHGLALALLEQESYVEAMQACNEVISIDEEFSIVHLTLGRIRMRLGDEKGAKEAFEKGLEIANRKADQKKADRPAAR